MPTLDGEASYEMLMDRIRPEWPRAMFWLCMVNGAAGHTYGANGIWQCNRKEQPHGKSPHGGSYGTISWDDAMRLPGSRQIGQAKAFIAGLPWTQLVPLAGAARWADRAPWGDWIWFPEGDPSRDAPAEARYFRRTFTLPAGLQAGAAVLQIAADDRFTAWLNGAPIGTGEGWEKPGRFAVGAALRPGLNVLAVKAENLPGPAHANPAGLIAGLAIMGAGGGATVDIPTDAEPGARRRPPRRSGWARPSTTRSGPRPWSRRPTAPAPGTASARTIPRKDPGCAASPTACACATAWTGDRCSCSACRPMPPSP